MPQHEEGRSMLARIQNDMRVRLAAGERVDANSYLEEDSSSSDTWFVVEVILAEFLARQQAGQRVYPAELFLRFPQWGGELRRELENRGLLDSTGRLQRRADRGTGAQSGGDDLPPSLVELGPFELVREVGQGGVGRVFQVRDLALGRVVALKVLRSGPVAASEEVARFQREARMAACLDHPNLMPIYSIGLFQGQYAITMPYLAGGNLLQHQAKYREIRSAVSLLLKVCRAVAMAHRAGIVHRDLKPGNILLDEAGEPVVGDFGLARFTDSDSEMTRPGQVLGTPGYMSPEQAGGRGLDVGPASDVWSLGVILYLLLTGRKPFEAGDNWQLLQKLRWSTPPSPRSLRQDLPGDLDKVVLKCLEKAPRDRYAHAGPLGDDLEHWLRGEPVSASRPRLRWLRPGARSWPLLAVGGLGSLLLALGLVMPPGQSATDGMGRSKQPPEVHPREHPPAQNPLIAGMPRPKRTPEEFLREWQLQLGRQQPVTLVRMTGEPDRFRWIEPTLNFNPSWSSTKPLTWGLNDWSLLELMPAVPLKRYQVSAQVLQRQNNRRSGIVGLYFLHRQTQQPLGDEHFLMYCGFREHHQPLYLTCTLRMSRYFFPKQGIPFRANEHVASKFLPTKYSAAAATLWTAGVQHQAATPWMRALHFARLSNVDQTSPQVSAASANGIWHTIVVDITPDEIRATLDDKLVLETRCADLEHKAHLLFGKQGAVPQPFLAGGIGLLVFEGTASFRNVVLTPLPED